MTRVNLDKNIDLNNSNTSLHPFAQSHYSTELCFFSYFLQLLMSICIIFLHLRYFFN